MTQAYLNPGRSLPKLSQSKENSRFSRLLSDGTAVSAQMSWQAILTIIGLSVSLTMSRAVYGTTKHRQLIIMPFKGRTAADPGAFG